MSNHPHIRPNGNQQPGIAVTVNPAPVPTQVVVEQADGPQGPIVVIRFFTPTGQSIFFLPVDAAKQVGQMITDRATTIRLAT